MTDFRSYFADNAGANEPRELLWENILKQVIALFSEAERRIRSAEGIKKYTALDGWWRGAKVKLKDKPAANVPSEEALSEALVDEVEKLMQDIQLKLVSEDAFPNIDRNLQFSLEAPRRRKKGIGKKAKPTDIRVYKLGSEIIDLRIEAKTVLRDRDLPNAYLSKEGLKRFSDPDEPYTDHEIGGMLAYTLCEDRSKWQAKIDQALGSSSPPISTFRHQLGETPAHETLFCKVPYCAQNGASRSEVLVFHMVLEFDWEPSVR